jgi:hypothetical protein
MDNVCKYVTVHGIVVLGPSLAVLRAGPELRQTMSIEGAVVREQGVTFAIAIVKPHVLNATSQANEAIGSFRRIFPGVPVVLMAQDTSGRPTYYGRRDIVDFLANVPLTAIPWKRYELN